MTTNTSVDRIGAIAEEMVQAAVESLAAVAGLAVAGGSATIRETFDATALIGAAVARSMLHGGASPGGLVSVVPAAGLAGDADVAVEPTGVIDALAAGAATALSRALGLSLQAAPAEALPAEPGAAGLGQFVIEFTIEAGGQSPVPIVWVVEASLGALLGGGSPVTPPPAAPGVAPAALPDLGPGAAPGRQRDLHLLADVPMNVTVELGRALMQVRELLSLEPGSVVELDRAAGASVDVLVNGTLVARGDVVVVDDQLGVRITEIVER
jgi:flagellar motor switch protein FliN/FliY